MRRGTPEVLVATLIVLLLGSYVFYTQRVVTSLRGAAERSSRMYSRVYRALSDTSEGAAFQALFEISADIRQQGVPLILTDSTGAPVFHANLPFDRGDSVADRDPRIRAYVRALDRQNVPVDEAWGQVHYGNTPLVYWLRIIPPLQAVTALLLLLAGFYIIRTRSDAAREHLWAGMARESAHQLGTPLSSIGGWIELLEERGQHDPGALAMAAHMRADVDRLDRVAHRFERIGREPRRDSLDLREIVDRVAAYFRARVPTLANSIAIDVEQAAAPLHVMGDAVLLEWALEVLVKNAVDAMAGRGGRITLSTARLPEGAARIRVADDGPGIPRELRDKVFEPGFSTKRAGWGIGLSLAKRIVEENHGGRLALVPADRGATFDVIIE
ncbi:MAG TPA: HAMP domain-containing sensor histidine kinase [Gemmatimonadaceae bacterium]|nr:HAMP domain-containing sensor histidine kinase [Gemmatimonadaceae bacterium]